MAKTASFKLSDDLEPIHRLELKLGNRIIRVDAPAGTECPLAVIFRDPLHLADIAKLKLSASVTPWSSNDPHYPQETGYRSNISKHAVAGPTK